MSSYLIQLSRPVRSVAFMVERDLRPCLDWSRRRNVEHLVALSPTQRPAVRPR